MRNVWRLSIVFVIGVVSFLVAIHKLNQPPFSSCQQEAKLDKSYAATIDEVPSVVIAQYHLTITHNGEPVDQARVCMRADMGGAGGMSGMGVISQAAPVGPGSYEVPVRFIMQGPWQGSVLIQRSEGDNVEIPIRVNVSL